jgi:hypothetical protein
VKSTYPSVHIEALMDSRSTEIDLGVLRNDDWIKLNKDGIGFYITLYSNEMFENMLVGLADSNQFGSPLDRIGIVNEAFANVSYDSFKHHIQL